MVSERRVAIVAGSTAALHGLDGSFAWGAARTFAPAEGDALAAWAPSTVFALDGSPPGGPWRTIAWGAEGPRRQPGGPPWRRTPLPAADALDALRDEPGTGVLLAGGEQAARESALAKLRARGAEARGAAALSHDGLAFAAVVGILGAPGGGLPPGATAVLAAGRLLVAPHADPAFGLLAWSDHLPYANEDELVFAADAGRTFPDAFEPIVAMGVLAAEAHRASTVYGRIAIDAELEDAAG